MLAFNEKYLHNTVTGGYYSLQSMTGAGAANAEQGEREREREREERCRRCGG